MTLRQKKTNLTILILLVLIGLTVFGFSLSQAGARSVEKQDGATKVAIPKMTTYADREGIFSFVYDRARYIKKVSPESGLVKKQDFSVRFVHYKNDNACAYSDTVVCTDQDEVASFDIKVSDLPFRKAYDSLRATYGKGLSVTTLDGHQGVSVVSKKGNMVGQIIIVPIDDFKTATLGCYFDASQKRENVCQALKQNFNFIN